MTHEDEQNARKHHVKQITSLAGQLLDHMNGLPEYQAASTCYALFHLNLLVEPAEGSELHMAYWALVNEFYTKVLIATMKLNALPSI